MSAEPGAARNMRAMVLHEWGGPLALEERPIPSPRAGEVLVRVIACGAGLTLVNVRSGVLGGDLPFTMGHEFGGVIERLGDGVSSWHVDQRVTASFHLICGHCVWCASGRETLCANLGGVIGASMDGAFADYVIVPERNLVAVPDGLELGIAGVASDAVATPYHAARARARLAPGQRAAVIGAGGGVGVHMVEVARAFGADVTAVERDPVKVDRLRELGLGTAILAEDGMTGTALADAAGGQFDAVFDFVSTPQTIRQGVDALGRGGVLVIVGASTGTADGIHSIDLINKEKSIVGSRYATRAEIQKSLQLVADGNVSVHIGARFDLPQIQDAFAAITSNAVFGRVIIDVCEKS
ncbi:MAG: alcohol dehydrogenase catalytic domain-containing protein [Actinobacteria bacterium]|nr:alcohol dehydrogenase catalytic domain-containing protein [Actinomycetota bacterium]